MAKQKVLIDGEELTRQYNLRTTDFILNSFAKEATSKRSSINDLINKSLIVAAKRYEAKHQPRDRS